MLNVFEPHPQGLRRIEPANLSEIPPAAVWLDLLEPTPEEEKAVEAALDIDVPTREEMKEIEASNRLYEENGALYMTATVAAKLDTDRPVSTAVTFILARGKLVTNRYLDTKPFQQFIAYAAKHPAACQANIFARNGNSTPDSNNLRSMIERIGFNGDINSRARESLVSLGRLLMFVQQTGNFDITDEQRKRFRSVSRDVTSLSDHASFLGSKVSFLLEATLGLINVEQNNIIKIFSVAAVMFMPPTLIASIYGMNFHLLPDLPGKYGNFGFSIALMIASMGLTYAVFRRKGWL
jgi:magnesium transporter